MFFNQKIKYNTKPVIPKYPSVCSVWEWSKDVPKTDGLDANLVSYIQPKWKYVLVKRDFQKEIDSQYCITPKMVATTNIKIPNPQTPQYQKTPLNYLNATDIRTGSKIITDSFIKKQSETFANNVIQKIKVDDKDLKIKELQNEIETLKKGVK